MSDIYFIGLKVSFVCGLTGLIVFCGFNVMAAKSGQSISMEMDFNEVINE
jgi:hypothetical protein